MSHSPLSLLRQPPPPRVREAALDSAYVVSRNHGNGAVLERRAEDGTSELARSELRGRVDWRMLARAILTDALDGRFSRKLAHDYSRFIVTARGEALTITGQDLQLWLDTWDPPLVALFGTGR